MRLDRAGSFKRATALVINALLQRSGARAAPMTARGFRDVPAIARGNLAIPFKLN